MRRLTTLAATLAATLILAACGDSSPPIVETDTAADEVDEAEEESEPDETSEPADEPDDVEPVEERPEEPEEAEEPDAPEAARAYFDAMATLQPSTMRQMLDHAVEGSPAYVYASVQVAAVEALADQGMTDDAGDATVTETGMRVCNTDIDGSRNCTDMEELTVTNGKLATFTVDGTQIDDRLAAGGATATEGATSVTLLGAYHSIQGDVLLVALDIVNEGDEPTNLNIYSAEYVNDAGRQVSAGDAIGPSELRGGAAGSAVIYIPAQSVGGTFYLDGSSDDFMTSYEWELQLTPID
jgi:hypothetical protein